MCRVRCNNNNNNNNNTFLFEIVLLIVGLTDACVICKVLSLERNVEFHPKWIVNL